MEIPPKKNIANFEFSEEEINSSYQVNESERKFTESIIIETLVQSLSLLAQKIFSL